MQGMKGHPRKSLLPFTRPSWPPGHKNAAVPTACNSTSLPKLGKSTLMQHHPPRPSDLTCELNQGRDTQCLVSSWESFRGLLEQFPRARVTSPYTHGQHNLFHTLEPEVDFQWLKSDLIDETTELCLSGWWIRKTWTSSVFLPEDRNQK